MRDCDTASKTITRRSLVATLLGIFAASALLSGQTPPLERPLRSLFIGNKWAAEIRKAEALTVFYLTWARKATPDDQSVLNDAYVKAARANRAMVAPVGMAWNEVRQKHPSIDLFYTDGSHPSAAGTYLAACTFYAALFNASPVGLPAKK